MRKASLARYNPKLQGIFGPLDKRQVEYIRRVLAEVDRKLALIARHFAANHAGLEMKWYESGQLAVGGHVETGDAEAHAAAFLVELWPSWVHEQPGRTSEWVVEMSSDVDCQHVPDDKSMDSVFSRQVRRNTPESAAGDLLEATRQLAALAMNNPIEYWTSKARD